MLIRCHSLFWVDQPCCTVIERDRGMKGRTKQRKDINESHCSLSWEKLKEMKENQVEFWAGDGFKRLRIVELDEKTKCLHLICQLGKITWPLPYQKLEKVHRKIHEGEIGLIPYEIDKVVPTWGNYITGLLKYLGCK